MSKCPVFQIADVIGKKWTIVLMQEIALNGKKGFNAIFKRMRKISPKILSKRLKQLENEGVIEKEVIDSETPLRTKYKLTEKGKKLQNIINSLKDWNIRYSYHQLECDKKECAKCDLY